jgi:hypothetical protein
MIRVDRATCEEFMPEEWFVEAVDQVTEAGRQACEAVQVAIRALEVGREARLAGKPLSEIVHDLMAGGGRQKRLGSAEAFRQYEQAVASMRAGIVRALVDEDDLSLTEVSRRLGVSRQAVARLYQPGAEQSADGPARKM